MKSCHLFLPVLSALALIPLIPMSAQAPRPRLQEGIREGTRALLPGSMPPRAIGAKDLGALRAGDRLEGMTLVFRRTDAQEAELQQLMAAQQDPASPQFHRWLTPEGFGVRFGMTDSDLETTSRWLSGHGFEISGVSRARDRITFSGTAEQVTAAFSATLHHFLVDGEIHVAPDAVLSLPTDLASITTDVLHLSDFRPSPKVRLSPQPAYTSANTQAHYLSPQDLSVMYDFPENKYPYPGSGQTIAIVGQSYVDLGLNSVVRKFFTSTAALRLTPVLVPGTGVQAISPGDAVESEIDLEYSAGLLNSANVLLVYVGSNPNHGVFDALSFAVDQNIAPVISISYGECETMVSPAELAQGNALFEQAVTQGQTLIAASGDSGSTACAPYPTSPSLTGTQQQALAVDYPASSPYVTAVGGTQMTPNAFAAGSSTYWRAAIPPFDTVQSLLSYVPETTWNEGSVSGGIAAGGGGASTSVARPSWQSNVPGIPAGTTRLLPDIALQASGAAPGFLFCADDLSFVRQFPTCGNTYPSQSTYGLAGGTSFAAPTFAAMVAVLNQNTQTLGQGNVNPMLYRLAGDTTTAASVFHDITSGTIACIPGAPLCSTGGQSGFAATAGYDQATGLGSLDVLRLLTAWPQGSAAAKNPTVASLSPFQTAIQPGQTDAIYISVASVYQPTSLTPPTGGVSVAVDGATVIANLPFATIRTVDNSGSATYSYTAPATTGSHVIVVTYPGDSTHGPSSTTTAILVGNVLASGGITVAAGNVTVPANGTAATTVTVTPSGGYNGRLFWSLSLASSTSSSLTGCYRINPLVVQGSTSTMLLLGVGTACSKALPAIQGAQPTVDSQTTPKAASQSSWTLVPLGMALLLGWRFPGAARRRGAPFLFSMMLIAPGFWLLGCGSSNSGAGSGVTTTPIAPQVATYTATLTGRDSVNGAIASSGTFTLTVQ